MRRYLLALAAALALISPLRADTISSELAASAPRWQPDNASAALIAANATAMYEAIQDGGSIFGYSLTPDERPILTTRRLLAAGHLVGLAALGDDFVVAWDTGDHRTVWLRRIGDGKEVHLDIATDGRRALAWNGTQLLVAYERSPRIYGVLLDRDLGVTVPEFTIATNLLLSTAMATAGQFAVLTDISPSVDLSSYRYFTVDSKGHAQLAATSLPSLAFTNAGSELLFFFTSAFPRRVWVQRYSLLTLVPLSDLILIAEGDGVSTPSATIFGGELWVGWNESGDFYVRGPGTEKRLIASGVVNGRIDRGPGTLLAGWQDSGGNGFVRRIDVEDDPHPTAYTPAQQSLPSIASDGANAMVAWAEDDVRIARITPDGSALDGAGVVISQSPAHPSGSLQILFDGRRYLVFWVADGAVFARYVGRDGTPAGDAFRVSPPDQTVARVNAAWTGTEYVLAWRGEYAPVMLAHMTPGGSTTVTGPVFVQNYLIANGENFALAGGAHPLAVGFTSNDGLTVIHPDTGEQSPLSFSIPGGWVQGVHLASNGRDYVLTWTTSRFVQPNSWANEVWAARFDGRGQLLGSTLLIATATSIQPGGIPLNFAGEAIPLFDGTRYRIVYAGTTLGEAALNDDAFVCHCFERTEVPFDATSIRKLAATVGAGGVIIAYDRADTPPGDATHNRIFVRFARPAAPPRRHAAGN